MEKDSALLRRHHELFAGPDEPFTEDWAIDYFEYHKDDLDIEYSGESGSNNPAGGDEAEVIYSERHGEDSFYWICTSTGGPQGPFAGIDQAVSALGYDPKTFELEPDSEDEDDEEEES